MMLEVMTRSSWTYQTAAVVAFGVRRLNVVRAVVSLAMSRHAPAHDHEPFYCGEVSCPVDRTSQLS